MPLLVALGTRWGERRVLASNLLILVLPIFNTTHEYGGLVRENEAVRGQEFVAGVEDSVEHALIEEEVTHPLGNDDVHLGEWHLDLLHLSLYQGDLIRHAVDLDNLPGLENDCRHVYADDVLGTSFDGEPAW
jgi:hypothetical protein